ncbi:hypothetical protein MHU86_8297 [Fragilaria crotonensis]|nr:hypothetical protein MHU86_8297 [Fragilaria crotonensis]
MDNEIDLLKRLDHPNIVKVYETYRLKGKTAVVMELCTGGDLFTRHPYSERQASNLVRQVLSAAIYLHDRNIVHRDLKYENIMFADSDKDDFTAKVIDFGLAKKYLYTHDRLFERVGTIYTMAPEVTLAEYSGSQADMWSIGVITYMLLAGEKPFWAETRHYKKIREGKVTFESNAWKSISDDAKAFVASLLKMDPAQRMTARAAAQHPFISMSMRLSILRPPPEISHKVKRNLVRYAESTDFKKIALLVIARKMSTEEILDLRGVFAEFDTSNDGTVSFDEFKEALSRLEYTEQDLEHTFRSIDVNHTGNILYTGNIDNRRLADAFHELDEDGSGYISREDLRTILPSTVTDEEIDKLIADVDRPDSDGRRDGLISFEEFQSAFSSESRRNISRLYD